MDSEAPLWRSLGLPLVALAALLLLPFAAARFTLYFVSITLVMGLLVTSLNLVLGYGGMYQFNHAVFYGLGAYAFALSITKGGLPFWAAMLIAPLASSLLGLVMGAICVRLSKLYFGMLQISLGSLVWAIVFRWYSFTGGDNGIQGVTLPDLVSSTRGSYTFVVVVVAVCLAVMHRIVGSPFGKIFQSLRDNPIRSEGIGVDVKRHQLIGLVLAAFFAGVAGSLYVVVEGSAVPDLLSWTLSMEILIMCLLGGWFTFLGPMVGAAAMLSLRQFAGMYTEYWTMILGILLMVLIFFLPDGLCGSFLKLVGRRRREGAEPALEAAPAGSRALAVGEE